MNDNSENIDDRMEDMSAFGLLCQIGVVLVIYVAVCFLVGWMIARGSLRS